jgi:hypothetical protein
VILDSDEGTVMDTPKTLHDTPRDVGDADDVNAAIRATWADVCRDFPNATTPLVAKRVAQEYDVPVSRVLSAFPASRDDSEGARI